MGTEAIEIDTGVASRTTSRRYVLVVDDAAAERERVANYRNGPQGYPTQRTAQVQPWSQATDRNFDKFEATARWRAPSFALYCLGSSGRRPL